MAAARRKNLKIIRHMGIILFSLLSVILILPGRVLGASRYLVQLAADCTLQQTENGEEYVILQDASCSRKQGQAGTFSLLSPAQQSADSSAAETVRITAVCPEKGIYTVENEQDALALSREGLAVTAEPDYEVTLFDTETDCETVPKQGNEEREDSAGQEPGIADSSTALFSESQPDFWYRDSIAAAAGDEVRCAGKGVRIGVIDSGAASHPDLSSCLEAGYDFLHGIEDTADNIGHGTFVAGLIAAQTTSGAIGCAPEACVIPIKCFDTGESTYTSTICAAIYAAVDDFHCDIINMSFGFEGSSRTIHTAVAYAYEKGVILVAAAGNKGNTDLQYPAAYEEVIGVGAIDRNNARCSFSQNNSSVFLTAPGSGLWGLDKSSGYTQERGTSFSAPLVAAAAARILSAEENTSPAELAELLRKSAEDLGEEGYDTCYGYGKLRIDSCFARIYEETPVFLSPETDDGSHSLILLKNNTAEPVTGVFFILSMNGEIFDTVQAEPVTLNGNSISSVSSEASGPVRCFFWDSAASCVPLSNIRLCGGKQ